MEIEPRDSVRRALRLAAAALAIAVLLAGSAAAPAAGESAEAWVRRHVESWIAHNRHSGDLLDVDALAAEAVRMRAGGASGDALVKWLNRELGRAEYAFAPRAARHDDSVRYALPFDPLYPRLMRQGPGGTFSHTGRLSQAFDFVMPLGTPVLAAREGVVASVVDGFREGGPDPALLARANCVYVLHSDGTFGTYVHLSPGIAVKVGQRVAAGETLGKSGNTGFSAGPHLHFAVARVDPDGADATTVPLRFGVAGGPGFVPKEGAYVGRLPRPNLDLGVSVEGRPPGADGVVDVREGESLRLRVEARPRGAAPREITLHPRVELVSMTPWSLDVLRAGEVAIRPMKGFPADGMISGQVGAAAVAVYFLNPSEQEIGFGKVDFRVRRAGAP